MPMQSSVLNAEKRETLGQVVKKVRNSVLALAHNIDILSDVKQCGLNN